MARIAVVSLLCLLVVVGISFFTTTVEAQITNVTGDQAPPIEGAGHDYLRILNETVNPGNGSVSIRISVPTPPGRGLTVPFSFGYDSNAALHLTTAKWKDNTGFLAQGGWRYVVPVLTVSPNALVNNQGQSICKYFTDYMLTDLYGGTHALYISTIEPLDFSECLTYYGAPPGFMNYFAGGDAQMQAATSTQTGWTMPPVNVADMHGTVYSFPATSQGFVTNQGNSWDIFPSTVEDRNGNKITISGTQTPVTVAVTDTFGRTTLSVSGFGSTGNTVATPGAVYTLTWGTFTETSSFPFVGQRTAQPYCNAFQGGGGGDSNTKISGIALPNGKSYQFQYDSATGLLSKLIYPSGGYVRYVWGLTTAVFDVLGWFGSSQQPLESGNCEASYEDFVLQKRFVSFDGVHEVEEQDFAYSTSWSGDINLALLNWTQRQTIVTTKDLIRSTSFNTTYTYIPLPVPHQPNDLAVPGNGSTPVESLVQYYDSNGSLLRTVQKTYVDPHLPPDETNMLDNGQVSQVHNAYTSRWPAGVSSPACNGSFLCLANLTDKYEYDYGSGSHGPLLRQTHYDYATFAATPIFPTEPSILDRPSDVITYDGSGSRIVETDYAYDLTSVGLITATGHDDINYGTSFNVRANLTTQTRKCFVGSTTCTDSVTTRTYDETGQVLSKKDPCGNGTCSDMTGTNHVATYSYADNYTVLSGGQNVPYTPTGNTNTYLTGMTDALGHTSSFKYDFNNGQLTKWTDPNNQSTTYIHNDPLSRPTQATFPDGGQTETAYNDAAPSPTVTTCQLISGTAGATCSATSPATGWMTSLATMDGLGHVLQTKLVSDPDGATYTARTYDGLARPYQAYNPTRCNPPTTSCGETTWGYATYTYDALGRTTQINQPDGSIVSTAFSGNQTTVTDEVLNQRKSQTDGLGHLTKVWEAPASIGYSFESDYQYDASGSLLCAVQKGTDTAQFSTCAAAPAAWRPRSFTYDSLSRLLTANNPESGTINYSYDLNGNLSSKVAPKSGSGTGQTTTNYSYDVLNRLTRKAYINPNFGAAQYAYDGTALTTCNIAPPSISSPTNLTGRRSTSCSELSASKYSYDPMGRTIVDVRRNKGSATLSYTAGYQYFKDGSLNKLTYPSGNVVTYTVGGASRATTVTDPSNNYATSARYAPNGALTSMTSGSGLLTTNIYNDRLQPILLSAAVSPNPAFFSLCYDFHLRVAVNSSPCVFSAYTSGDNGNASRILNNVDSTRSQTFTYDPLNRISQANTITTTGANCWGETYTIDPWGNLYNRNGVSGMTGCSYEPLSTSATTKNQLAILTYDAAGNVTNDGNGNMPTYDAENRIATDVGVSYYYDADGVRTEKSSGTMYWPGTPGVLTETDLAGTINAEYVYFNGQRTARVDRPSGTAHYYFSDHLGSASVVADAAGNVQERYFYYPFGGQQSSSGGDPNHYKFTGKERDSETGLDNFGARYNASSLGRFMTPDPLLNSGRPWQPQSWNRYAYSLNNPLKFVDPTGLYEWAANTCAQDDKKCNKQYLQNQQKVRDALSNLEKARDSFMKGSKEYNRLDASLKAYGTEGEANGVSVGFGVVKNGAAETIPMNNNTSWLVKFDTSKITGGSVDWASASGHEGTHVDDFRMPLDVFMKQSPFSMEYRGYEASAWTAQGLGAGSLSFSGNVIWNSSWAEVDRATLRDKAITKEVVDHYPDHPETQPHNPLPN